MLKVTESSQLLQNENPDYLCPGVQPCSSLSKVSTLTFFSCLLIVDFSRFARLEPLEPKLGCDLTNLLACAGEIEGNYSQLNDQWLKRSFQLPGRIVPILEAVMRSWHASMTSSTTSLTARLVSVMCLDGSAKLFVNRFRINSSLLDSSP